LAPTRRHQHIKWLPGAPGNDIILKIVAAAAAARLEKQPRQLSGNASVGVRAQS